MSVEQHHDSRTAKYRGIWDIFLGVLLNGVLAPTFHLRAPSPTFVGPIPKRYEKGMLALVVQFSP
jgi:hypothetical protein